MRAGLLPGPRRGRLLIRRDLAVYPLGTALPGQGMGVAGLSSPVRVAACKPHDQVSWRGRPLAQV